MSKNNSTSFGSVMPGRNGAVVSYRYGINGQEKETEITGIASHSSAEYWMYDSRIGRRWEMDPITLSSDSPYSTFLNNPVVFSDPKGDFPAWYVIMGGIALVSYGMEVYNNWDSDGSMYNNLVGNINWLSIAADAASVLPGGGWIIKTVVEGIESSVEWTPNGGLKFNNVDESVKNFIFGKINDNVARSFDTYIRKIGSDKVIKQSSDKIKEHTKKANVAEKKAATSTNTQKTKMQEAKADAHKAEVNAARKQQVRSEMSSGY